MRVSLGLLPRVRTAPPELISVGRILSLAEQREGHRSCARHPSSLRRLVGCASTVCMRRPRHRREWQTQVPTSPHKSVHTSTMMQARRLRCTRIARSGAQRPNDTNLGGSLIFQRFAASASARNSPDARSLAWVNADAANLKRHNSR
jgi:hypothetical protein